MKIRQTIESVDELVCKQVDLLDHAGEFESYSEKHFEYKCMLGNHLAWFYNIPWYNIRYEIEDFAWYPNQDNLDALVSKIFWETLAE